MIELNENTENLDEFNDENNFKFTLEMYEGPLFLLLDLIKEHKLAIEDVKLADITEQYLEHIKNMENLDMEKATEFLAMATILIEIKSRSLLPHEDDTQYEEELDPEVVLKKQLELLALFQEASDKLQKQENVDRLYKEPDKSAGDVKIIFNEFNYDGLLDAFALVLSKAQDKENPVPTKSVEKERWTVAEKISFIKSVLKEHKEIFFFDLFDETYSKMEIITIFLALLELLKFQQIYVKQENKYGNIKIVAKENIDDEITGDY